MDISLLRTAASGDLLPARLAPLLARWSAPRAKIRGQQLMLAERLDVDDNAAAGFVLDFAGQGARIEASARGASSVLLAWSLSELARLSRAELSGDAAERAPALAYLHAYEADVEAHRKNRPEAEREADAFVLWLGREEVIEVRPGASFEGLDLTDAARVYETLLEHDAVEDIFVSERELTRLLSRFRAR